MTSTRTVENHKTEICAPDNTDTVPAPGGLDNQKESEDSLLKDRGWAWLVMFGCFLSHLITGGLERSDGILFLKLRARYGDSAQVTAWPGALAATVCFVMGPIGGTMSSRLSARASVMLGSFLYSLGLICSGLAPTMPVLLLCFGFLQGVGRGLTYAPGLIMVGMYFQKRRGVGVGVGTAGVGAGTFLLPPLIEHLFEVYGFSGAFLILGGLALNFCLVAMLYRPLYVHANIVLRPSQSYPASQSRDGVSSHEGEGRVAADDSSCDGSETRRCLTEEKNDDNDNDDDESNEIRTGTMSVNCSSAANEIDSARLVKANNKNTAEDVEQHISAHAHINNDDDIILSRKNSDEVPNMRNTHVALHNGATQDVRKDEDLKIHDLEDVLMTEAEDEATRLISDVPTVGLSDLSDGVSKTRLTAGVKTSRVLELPTDDRDNSSSSLPLVTRESFSSDSRGIQVHQSSQEKRGPADVECYSSDGSVIIPINYSKTRFRTSSSLPLPMLRNEKLLSDGREFHHTTQPASTAKTFRKRVLRPALSCLRTCFPVERGSAGSGHRRPLVDCSLLRQPAFLLYCLSICLFTASMKSSLVFLPPLVRSSGASEIQAAYLLSLSGVMDTVGRITTSVVLELKVIRHWRLAAFTGFVFAIGALSFVSPFLSGFGQFGVAFGLFGFLTGSYVSQKSVVLVDMLGTQRLASSFGLLTFFQGLGNFVGPPLSGVFRDTFGQYREVFFLGGGCLAVAGGLMLLSNVYAKKR